MITIKYRTEVWPLDVDGQITFGRSSENVIVIGRNPPDSAVSRFAGYIHLVDQEVQVHNSSKKHKIYLVTQPGPEDEVRPQRTVSIPAPRTWIIVPGTGLSQYEIFIDARPIGDASATHADTPASDDESTWRGPEVGSADHLILLAASEPLFIFAGSTAKPASKDQIAERLGLSSKYVGNRVSNLFRILRDAGVPGFATGDPPDQYLPQMVDWAIRTQIVKANQLSMLRRRSPKRE